MKNSNYLLLAPGPVQLHPLVIESLSLPMIHHRTPLFDEIFKRVLLNLKAIFQTQQNCYMLSSTGSGGMECLLVNPMNIGDKVLVINSGKFGERWVQMAKDFQLDVIEHQIPWGNAVVIDDIEKLLKIHSQTSKPISAVFCQATETSTTVAHPIEQLGKLIHQFTDTLFLVDGITALGAYHLPMDEWHIDGLVGGSQKAFMLPTGMSFVSFSEKAWHKIRKSKLPKYYFNIVEEDKANRNGETWFSSNVTLIRALDVVLNLILSEGLNSHFAQIIKRAKFTRHFGDSLNLELATQYPSFSVTGFKMPSGIDGQKIRSQLEKDFSITIMGGQDQWKGKVLRIGHMGYIQNNEMIQLMLALQSTICPNQELINTQAMSEWINK